MLRGMSGHLGARPSLRVGPDTVAGASPRQVTPARSSRPR